jgi:hypothetical protein
LAHFNDLCSAIYNTFFSDINKKKIPTTSQPKNTNLDNMSELSLYGSQPPVLDQFKAAILNDNYQIHRFRSTQIVPGTLESLYPCDIVTHRQCTQCGFRTTLELMNEHMDMHFRDNQIVRNPTMEWFPPCNEWTGEVPDIIPPPSIEDDDIIAERTIFVEVKGDQKCALCFDELGDVEFHQNLDIWYYQDVDVVPFMDTLMAHSVCTE